MGLTCKLCPKACQLEKNERGDCRARANVDGKLLTLVYGRPCALHIDPIEKKPLYHFYPGSPILSLATAGCNLHCKNCQNWQISQANPEDVSSYRLSPQRIVDICRQETCSLIAYTYTEPLTFYEYTYDTASLARSHGLRNVLVTAGYVNREPLEQLCGVVDAANVDLKFFDDRMYQKITTARLGPILDNLVLMRQLGMWLEITHLIIPTLNDDMSLIKSMCRWIGSNLGTDVPIHFSRFHPHHLLRNLPPTPVETLTRARDIGLEWMQHVYIGNVWGGVGEHTYCPNDGRILIRRAGYTVLENNIVKGKCRFCGTSIAGWWA